MHIFILRANTAITPVSWQELDAIYTKELTNCSSPSSIRIWNSARARSAAKLCDAMLSIGILSAENIRQSYRLFNLKLYICNWKSRNILFFHKKLSLVVVFILIIAIFGFDSSHFPYVNCNRCNCCCCCSCCSCSAAVSLTGISTCSRVCWEHYYIDGTVPYHRLTDMVVLKFS